MRKNLVSTCLKHILWLIPVPECRISGDRSITSHYAKGDLFCVKIRVILIFFPIFQADLHCIKELLKRHSTWKYLINQVKINEYIFTFCQGKHVENFVPNLLFSLTLVYKYLAIHSLIRGILIQSCSSGAKNFTNYVFCHV